MTVTSGSRASGAVREKRTKALSREEGGSAPPDATERLERLARLYREGAVTEEEYDAAKAALLDEI